MLSIIRFCFFLSIWLVVQASWAETTICGNVVLVDGNLKLNANEKILVCGSDKSELAWREIPLSQAQFVLKSFLQNHGYLNPRFEIKDDKIYVYAGSITNIEKFEIEGEKEILHADRKRKVVGYPLEPERLDEIEQWADLRLRRNAYACPEVGVNAQAWNGLVTASVNPGQKGKIAKVERIGYEGLDVLSLSRFEAFDVEDDYDVVDTNITVSRLIADGLFQNTYVTTTCQDDHVNLKLFADRGKARIFRFGIGASTEEFPFVDLWYKDTLLDDRASNYTASLHASPILQQINLNSEIYLVPYSHLFYFGPRLVLEKRIEKSYRVDKTQVGIDLGRSWDHYKIGWNARVGPTYNTEKTISGEGPDTASYVTWDGIISLTSHAYEAFVRDQYEGFTGDFRYTGQRKDVGSKIDVDRYDLNFKYLWNIGNYSPPALVLATRVGASVISASQATAERKDLPISFRIYYGGDDNLRGFERQTLDNGGRGYSSALFLGNELRLIERLPYRLEPLLLADIGKLAEAGLTFEEPIFFSWGGGLRWPSPFGTLRFLAARGQINNGNQITERYRQDWVYFISFGKEF